jgi:hypothetical protein
MSESLTILCALLVGTIIGACLIIILWYRITRSMGGFRAWMKGVHDADPVLWHITADDVCNCSRHSNEPPPWPHTWPPSYTHQQ